MSKLPPLWFHQERGIHGFVSSVNRGRRRVCLTSPTGGGKTRTVTEIAKDYLRNFKKVVWYTNRKMLLEQTAEVFDVHGLDVGKRASGHFPELHHAFQLASVQTERTRSLDSDKWELHDADLAIFDECHLQCNDTAARIMGRHLDAGAVILGATATPIDIGDFYDDLVVAGTNSELRDCGALVTAYHYGPDEPDLKQIGSYTPGDDLSENQTRKVMGGVDKGGVPDLKIKALFGRVLDWYRRLNPENKPTILFAPGVKESLWFAMQFQAAGIPAAHIDGEEVWVGGELHRSGRQVRQEVLDGSKRGDIKVVCNRFVLREGIDAPWLAHGIFATVFGSLQSYLQSGGRLLRSFPGLGSVTVQDHGGNWWRHGSLNADREWDLSFKNTTYAAQREDAFREGQAKEPVLCPECKKVLNSLRCSCGFVVNPTLKTRPVVMADGSLVEQRGDILPKRIRREKPDTQKLWTDMYYRAWNGNMTWKQAEALFCHENYYWPVRTLTLMPVKEDGIYRKVRDVPLEELRGPIPPSLAGWVRKRREKIDSTPQKAG